MTPIGDSIGKILKVKSTVRNRKKGAESSTQRFIPIAEIHNDTILLKNGGLRAVLKIEPINFNLKSETEQKSIIAGYGAFVNTLSFPLQIVLRSVKTDIDRYLLNIRRTAESHNSPLLKEHTLSYAQFIEKLIDIAEIMDKKFYVIIPIDHSTGKKKTLLQSFFGWMNTDDSIVKANQRSLEFNKSSVQLQERIELVRTGLANIGLPATKLTTKQLLELFYQIYNPVTSKNEKITGNQDALAIDKTSL